MKKQIAIHTAEVRDIESLNELAYAAKAFWRYPKHYLKIWKDEINVDTELIRQKRVYKAMDGANKLLGFYLL